jgi:hypothetical protein
MMIKNEVYFITITYSNNEKLPNTIDNYTIGTSVIPIDSGFRIQIGHFLMNQHWSLKVIIIYFN